MPATRLELRQVDLRLTTLERLAEALGTDLLDLLKGPGPEGGRGRKPGRGRRGKK